jgi:hypothetical protein
MIAKLIPIILTIIFAAFSQAQGTGDFDAESAKIRTELEIESREWKTGVILAATAAILSVAGLALSFVNHRQRGPRYFPLPVLTRRLGAPHAGGNQAVVNLGSPPS